MDRAEAITQELAAIAATFGHTVEIDRRYIVKPEHCPLIVVRTGDEENQPDGNPRKNLAMWTMGPSVEVYLDDPDAAAQRAELNRIWTGFIAALKTSRIPDLTHHEAGFPMRKTLLYPGDFAQVAGMSIDFEFRFRR